MKKIFINKTASILSIIFIITAGSCSKEISENVVSEGSSQKILITGVDANTITKTTINGLVTSWNAGDKVGIYSPQARTVGSGGTAIVNSEFTAASTGTSSLFNGTMYWGLEKDSYGLVPANHFYAYYPYSGSAGTDAAAVQITLATAQVQAATNSNAHIGALDFMIATPATVTPPGATSQIGNTVVSLHYNHVFTVLEFQIKGTGALKAVKLVSPSNPIAFNGGTINITQATPVADVAYTFASQTGTTTQAVVTLTTPVANLTATNTDTKVYMVINPGTQTGNYLIGLSSDGTTWTYISKAAPDGGFLRGKKYVVAIDQASAVSLFDQDNNVYSTVTINTQTWMASNLKTTKYNDGTAITNVTDNTAWSKSSTGAAYCWYNNDINNKPIYGALYNWYAVNTAKLCPVGWHVPTDSEWTTLTDYLEGLSVAGGKLKETGYTHWTTPNTGATNETGFTALPGGYRGVFGAFSFIGSYGYWWSSTDYTEFNTGDVWYRHMNYNNSNATRGYYDKAYGFSVRCLKN